MNHNTTKTTDSKDFDSTEMEIQTFQMLQSCASSLMEIKEILKSQSELQNEIMKVRVFVFNVDTFSLNPDGLFR